MSSIYESLTDVILSPQEYNQYSQLKRVVPQLQKRLKDATDRGDKLEKNKQDLNIKLAKYLEETSQLKENTKQLSRLALRKMKEGTKLQGTPKHELDAQNQKIAHLNDEKNLLQARIEELINVRRELDLQNQAVSTLSLERNRLQARIEELANLRNELDIQNQSVSTLNQEKGRLQARIQELTSIKDALRHELNVQNQTVTYLNEERYRLKAKIEVVENESIRYCNINMELEDAVEEKNNLILVYQQREKEWNEREALLQQDLNNVKKDRQELNGVRQTLKQRDQQSESLRKELSELKQSQENYQAKLRVLVGKSAILQQQKEKIQKQLESNKQMKRKYLIQIRDNLNYNPADFPFSEQITVSKQQSICINIDINKTQPNNPNNASFIKLLEQVSSIHSKNSTYIFQLQQQNKSLKEQIKNLKLKCKSFEEQIQKITKGNQEVHHPELEKKSSATKDQFEHSNIFSNSSSIDQSSMFKEQNSQLMASVNTLQNQKKSISTKYKFSLQQRKRLQRENEDVKEQLNKLREFYQRNSQAPNS